MSVRRPSPRPRLALLLVLCLGACVNAYPQRVPGPLFLPDDGELGEPAAPDAATITVQRSSDPVWVRRPGERGAIRLPFYRKRERVPVGAHVRTGAGGRAELLWAPDASSVALFDEGRVTVGDPERDEPMLTMHAVTRALLTLTPEDRVVLVGGSVLAGDPLETTGPILLETVPGSVLRVTNQSKRVSTIAFRDERLEVAPGESIDLPEIPGGASPLAPTGIERLSEGALSVSYKGRVEREEHDGGLALTALEPTSIEAQGIQVALEPGQTARFSGLSQVPPARPADPIAQP